MKRGRSKWESLLEVHMRERGLRPEVEYQFLAHRLFRFDFAFPSERVAAEVEGGIWTRGRHTRGAGYQSDLTKYNLAALEGWLVLRFSPEMISSLEAVESVEQALRLRREAVA